MTALMDERDGYRDGLVAVDGGVLTIGRYYFPLGPPKRIPLERIREVSEHPMGRWTGQWRLWGSGDLRHWWNLDFHRTRKTRMFTIDTGALIRPVATPDDADAFAAALGAAGVSVRRSETVMRFA